MEHGRIMAGRARIAAGCMALLALSAPAQADALLDEAVALNATILGLQSDAPGLIMGALRDGETAVFGFGETARGNGITPDGQTVLRIGSITKVFAGEMLAHAVIRGEARLTEPVAPLLPDALGQAAAKHPPIRLIDLATHAGGLPREVPRADGPPEDPFATITPAAFAAWLDENPLQFTPGSRISYSNFGFDLLSAALSTVGGAPYPDLLSDRITTPLGLADTGFSVTEAMAPRLMTGHAPDGSPLPEIPSGDVITGSGGLRSTANDLLRWMQWHLERNSEGGSAEVEARFLTHGVYVQRDGKDMTLSMDESGRMDAMGLGWVAMNATADRPFILQKAGALHGQMSYIAFAPEHGTAVFVAINQFDFGTAFAMTELANEFLAVLSGY